MTEEKEKKAKLTARQREFVKFYVDGIYSAKECAVKAGYAEDSAKFHASKLLNGRDFPRRSRHARSSSFQEPPTIATFPRRAAIGLLQMLLR